jgi:hypothetical protein
MFVYIVADVSSGLPCDKDGYDIPNGPHPPRIDKSGPIDFTPFETRAEFEFAEFLYSKAEMSAGKIDKLLEILAALYPERMPQVLLTTKISISESTASSKVTSPGIVFQ